MCFFSGLANTTAGYFPCTYSLSWGGCSSPASRSSSSCPCRRRSLLRRRAYLPWRKSVLGNKQNYVSADGDKLVRLPRTTVPPHRKRQSDKKSNNFQLQCRSKQSSGEQSAGLAFESTHRRNAPARPSLIG